ncbi:MAG: GxxExxY protein [Patescibacteria group bacterium]|nr:GxxExxY protein [Patescibacteria group bacterium]
MRTQINADLKNSNFLHGDLTFVIRGVFYEIRNQYGPGQKESVYENLVYEYLKEKGYVVEKQPTINIYSAKTNNKVGVYRPDLLVENKIIIEIKSARITTIQDEKQLYFYLRNSQYELGLLVNFSTPHFFIKRIIYSNSKKLFLKKSV